MTLRTAFLALLVALALPSSAPAQDSAPVIRELQINNAKTTQVPPGGVVTAIGRNFHQCPPQPPPLPGQPAKPNPCRHDELKVDVQGTDVLLLDSTFERVTFIVPQDTPVGRKRLRIEVRGRGNATFEFEVAPLTEAMRKQQELTETGQARPLDIEDVIREQFKITMFELKRDAAGARFEVAGNAGKVPDGFAMVVTLSINQRDIQQIQTTVSNQGGQATFRVTFGPYTKQLLYGNYAATCLFELSKQPRTRVREFRKALKPEELQVYDRIERREFLTVGTPAEVTDQTTAMQNHYRQHAEELAKLLLEAEKAYASGCRQHFKAAGAANFDEAAWTRYVTEMGFAPANDPNALNTLKNDKRFSSPQGHFKPDDYQKWAEEQFIPKLTAAFKKHREFRDSTIEPIEPRGELHADYLVSIVLESFREYTRNLYERSKIELPPSIATVAAVDPVPTQQVSRKFFEAQRRLLLRTVGLRNLVPDGE